MNYVYAVHVDGQTQHFTSRDGRFYRYIDDVTRNLSQGAIVVTVVRVSEEDYQKLEAHHPYEPISLNNFI